MECKHNEQKELLFYNRVEDRLDSKGTKSLFTLDILTVAGEMEMDGQQNG